MGNAPSKDARKEAAQIVGRVLRDGAYANRLLHATFQDARWEQRERSLLTELVYGVLRHLYAIDHALNQVAKKGLRSIDPAIVNHLRVAAYQLLYLDHIADYAVVSQAVKYIRKLRGQRVGGFANALLRKLQRDPLSFQRFDEISHIPEMLSKMYSHPQWLVERWMERFGLERTQKRLNNHNQPNYLTFRIHAPHRREDVMEKLLSRGIALEETPFSADGVRLTEPLSGSLSALLRDFPYLVVQDEAAQLVVHWLNPQKDELILDACAAPGGKTAHILSLAPKATVVACDVHAHKLPLIEKVSSRLNIGIPERLQLKVHDATKPFSQQFDRILCDAPCSGLGVMRKQPEIRYRRTPEEIEEMATVQKKILCNLADCLKPGGTMVFSVCTDTLEENEQVVQHFLQSQPKFSVVTTPSHPLMTEEGYLRTAPELHQMDAFFAVRLKKAED